MINKNYTVKLNNGVTIPQIGFGTSMIEGMECTKVILDAIEVGYRHIDTAHAYNNEKEIGKAIKQCNIKREKLFITSKVWKDSMGYQNTIKSFYESIEALQTNYLDLFLIHWPKNGDDALNLDTWKALEQLYKEGKIRAIGTSNFLTKHLQPLLECCEINPMVNQIEYHPGLIRHKTIDFCNKNNIVVEAWSPLGKGKMLDNDILKDIAKKYNKSVAQVCLKWCVQNNIIPLPKSQNKERMKQNLELYDFEISKEDMNIIDNMKFFAGSNMDPNSFNA